MTPARPSSHVKDLDPVVERIILHCLQKEPAKRPASALQVAAALPGGNPLAAALAAGETPSPEMVAAAGDEDALPARTAWLFLAGALAALALVVVLAPRAKLVGLAPIEKSPEVLLDRVREIAHQVGYASPPADSAFCSPGTWNTCATAPSANRRRRGSVIFLPPNPPPFGSGTGKARA